MSKIVSVTALLATLCSSPVFANTEELKLYNASRDTSPLDDRINESFYVRDWSGFYAGAKFLVVTDEVNNQTCYWLLNSEEGAEVSTISCVDGFVSFLNDWEMQADGVRLEKEFLEVGHGVTMVTLKDPRMDTTCVFTYGAKPSLTSLDCRD